MISIIVPVYNTEKYLATAIESVLSQSFSDWELILVDDGSTDSSGAICRRYAEANKKIKTIHKENGGLSSARNEGLKIAAGEFITFLDADDMLAPDALDTFSYWQNKTGADIICGSHMRFDKKIPSLKNEKGDFNAEHFKPVEAVEKILYQTVLDNSAWAKLYRAGLWKNERFREGSYYEDLDIFYKIFLKADYVAAVTKTVYFYRQHNESYVHTFNLRRKDMLTVTQRLVDYMAESYPSLLPAARSRQLSANFNMWGLIASRRHEIPEAQIREAEEISEKCLLKIKELRAESLFNPKVRLKNKTGIILSYIGGAPLLRILSKFIY